MLLKGITILVGCYFIYFVTGLLIGFEEFQKINKED